MFTLFLLSMVVVGVVINLSGLSALNFTPADRAALAQSTAGAIPSPPPAPAMRTVSLPLAGLASINRTASPPPPPPPPPPKTVIPLQAVSRAIVNQQNNPVPPGTDAQTHAANVAREAVYSANGISGEDRLTGNVDPAITAAANAAASQAMMHVGAAQASGQDTVSLDVDHVTGGVSVASLEDKVAALPLWAKAGLAIGAVLGIGKLVSKK